MENTMTMQENVMQMMNEQIATLNADLLEAKVAFAEINLEDGDYRCRDERKTNCKVIEGQIYMVKKMMDKISSMLPDIKMPMLAKI